jgi:signal transduction histidine kinase
MSGTATTLDVLLIEDNPGDVTLIEHHLSNPRVEMDVDDVAVTHESDLTTGRQTLADGHFDVMLLDLGLPESTGLATLERVLEDDPTLPIIVLTGLDDAEVSVDAIQKGAQDFLPKGDLDTDRLVRALRYAVERHEQERELRRRTEQIEFFNQILRHDISNGINVINANGAVLADRLDGEAADRARTIVEWSEDMSGLTQKVRSILATLTNEESRDLHRVELAPIATAQADRVTAMGEEIAVAVDVPTGLDVWADDLLEDVVGNLLVNAVEHGGDDVSIEITGCVDGNEVFFQVTDDGSDIPEDERASIFDRGYKGADSGGTGFGLYFVDAMVESYDGSIEVDSSDRGGTCFTLSLVQAV